MRFSSARMGQARAAMGLLLPRPPMMCVPLFFVCLAARLSLRVMGHGASEFTRALTQAPVRRYSFPSGKLKG